MFVYLLLAYLLALWLSVCSLMLHSRQLLQITLKWNNKSSFVRFFVHLLAYLLFIRAFIVPTRNSTYALNAV